MSYLNTYYLSLYQFIGYRAQISLIIKSNHTNKTWPFLTHKVKTNVTLNMLVFRKKTPCKQSFVPLTRMLTLTRLLQEEAEAFSTNKDLN